MAQKRKFRKNSFFKATHIPGFSFINDSATWLEAVFWYILMLFLLCITLSNLYDSVSVYLSKPTKTDVKIVHYLPEGEGLRPFTITIKVPLLELLIELHSSRELDYIERYNPRYKRSRFKFTPAALCESILSNASLDTELVVNRTVFKETVNYISKEDFMLQLNILVPELMTQFSKAFKILWEAMKLSNREKVMDLRKKDVLDYVQLLRCLFKIFHNLAPEKILQSFIIEGENDTMTERDLALNSLQTFFDFIGPKNVLSLMGSPENLSKAIIDYHVDGFVTVEDFVAVLKCMDPTRFCQLDMAEDFANFSNTMLTEMVDGVVKKAFSIDMYPQNVASFKVGKVMLRKFEAAVSQDDQSIDSYMADVDMHINPLLPIKSLVFNISLKSPEYLMLIQHIMALLDRTTPIRRNAANHVKEIFYTSVLSESNFAIIDDSLGMDYYCPIPRLFFSNLKPDAKVPEQFNPYGFGNAKRSLACDKTFFTSYHEKKLSEGHRMGATYFLDQATLHTSLSIIDDAHQGLQLHQNQINVVQFMPIGHRKNKKSHCIQYQPLCLEHCKLALHLETCKNLTDGGYCIPLYYQYLVSNNSSRLCMQQNSICQSDNILGDSDSFKCNQKCQNEMDDACNIMLYRPLITSLSPLIDKSYIQYPWNLERDKNYHLKYSVLLEMKNIGVAFPKFSEDYSMTISNFMAELGGLFDFWLGVSVISLVHALLFLIIRFKKKIKTEWHQNVVKDIYNLNTEQLNYIHDVPKT